jgi:membrane protein DedA with SNARE-associated domain
VFDWVLNPASYLGLFAAIALTGCGLPLPEEFFIVLAGVLSAEGKLIAAQAFAACLAGAVIGDTFVYAIGYRFGHSLLRRHPTLGKMIGAEREEQFERAIRRHGFKVLLLARFMVGVRAPVYLAAGVVRMPFRRFLLWDLVCATLVVGAFFGLSYYFGRNISNLLRQAEVAVTLVVLALVALIAFIALRRHRRRLLEEMIVGASEPASETSDRAPGDKFADGVREAS